MNHEADADVVWVLAGGIEECARPNFDSITSVFDALVDFVPNRWEGFLWGVVFGAVVDEVAKVFGGGWGDSAHGDIIAQMF